MCSQMRRLIDINMFSQMSRLIDINRVFFFSDEQTDQYVFFKMSRLIDISMFYPDDMVNRYQHFFFR